MAPLKPDPGTVQPVLTPDPGTVQTVAPPDPFTHIKHIAKQIGGTTLKGLTFPIEGLGAVMGAPQRGVASMIGQAQKNPIGVAETAALPLLGPYALADPRARKQLGNLGYAYTHPNDPSIEDTAMRVTGASKLKTNRNDLLGRAQNFAVDFGFQTATDPLTLAGGGIGKGIGHGLDALGAGADAAARATRTDAILDFFKPNALVRKEYKGHDLNVYEGTVEAQKAVARKKALGDEALLKQYAKHIASDTPLAALPDPLKERIAHLLGATGIEFPTKGPMLKRIEEFLGQAQAAERENLIKLNVEKHGLKYVQNPKNIGEALKNVPLLGPVAQTVSRIGTGIANAGKNTMFINSLPHMGNVGVAQFLGSGLGGVAGGLGRAVTGRLGKFANELEEFGVTSHFSAREPSAIERHLPVVGQLATKARAVSQGALDRFETGMRAQRYNQLRRAGMDPFDAAKKVRTELFDYTNTSGASRALSEAGAPFPQFRLNSVPMMGANALRNAPQRLAQYARAENLTNKDLVKSRKYGIDFAKPPDSFSQLLDFSPGFPFGLNPKSGTASYLTSPSTIGVWGAFQQDKENPQSVGQQLLTAASQYVPGVSAIETIADWQRFPSKAPKQVRDLLNLFGSYTKNLPKAKKGTIQF